ncbi:phage head closure protein [Pandoraea soli]
MIAAGTYRHRVTLQRQNTREDELGQPQPLWQDVLMNVSALVEDLSGRELMAAQEIHSAINVRIRLRFRPEIAAGMRALYKGQIFTIEAAIRTDAVSVELHLMCSTGLIQ